MDEMALAFRRVSKIYDGSRYALRELSFEIPAGRRIAIVGRSGSGKSTLLHLAAGIDVPSRGEVIAGGRNLEAMSERRRTLFRRHQVGLIFQFFHLLPHLTVRQNIALPEMIGGAPDAGLNGRIDELLVQVGLLERADDSVEALSGGEMQRVAVCRAMLRRPPLLLADEPTGSLDDESSGSVMGLLLDLTEQSHSTLVLATHSEEVAALADEVWHLHSGELS